MKKINVLFILALVCVFTACQLDTKPRVTVTFDDPAGGNRIASVTIEKGASLGGKLPTNLRRNDGYYTFYGWFEGALQYFADTPIGEDVTLTARWADEVVTVSFAFTQTVDGTPNGAPIEPAVPVNDVTAIKGLPLGPLAFPVTPRIEGWVFVVWLLDDGEPFFQDVPVLDDITVEALWLNQKSPQPLDPELTAKLPEIPTAAEYTVSFNSKGGAPVASIKVYANECIDEWRERFPPNPTTNSINPDAFFTKWIDDEFREYNGRTPITRNVELNAKWGLPPYVVDFKTNVVKVEADVDAQYGSVDYDPKVRQAWDSTEENPKWVIVNNTIYDVPNNTNRWRILYRISFKFPSTFSTEFYDNYTIRARFYANKQGTKSWTDASSFTPNKPADGAGYNKDGLLVGTSSPSDDGWGQISWTSVANWNGQGADADTMLQRYNLDRKGGTIDDTYAPLRNKDAKFPPFLIIQTSDAYIGHIEITEIAFHNGEKKFTMYTDEEGYATADDGLTPAAP